LDFFPQLLLDLFRMSIRERTVTAGVGVNLRAIQGHRAELEHPHRAGQLQHVDEQSLNLRQKAMRNAAIVS